MNVDPDKKYLWMVSMLARRDSNLCYAPALFYETQVDAEKRADILIFETFDRTIYQSHECHLTPVNTEEFHSTGDGKYYTVTITETVLKSRVGIVYHKGCLFERWKCMGLSERVIQEYVKEYTCIEDARGGACGVCKQNF